MLPVDKYLMSGEESMSKGNGFFIRGVALSFAALAIFFCSLGRAEVYTPAKSIVDRGFASGLSGTSGLAVIEPKLLSPRAGGVVFLSDGNTICNDAPGVYCCLIEQNKNFLLNLFGYYGKKTFRVGSLSRKEGGAVGSFSEGAAFTRARALLLENYEPIFLSSDVITPEFLSNVDIFFYFPASTSSLGYRVISQEEVSSIVEFVKSGGYFFLLGDNTSFASNGSLLNNVVANPFGVNYAGTVNGLVNLTVTDPSTHPILNQPFGPVTNISQCYPGAMTFFPISKPSLPPIADAGDDQAVSCTENGRGEARLSGVKSISPEGLPLSFNWSGPFGTAWGETPLVSLQLGSNEVSLLVEDVNGETAQDSVVISVVDDAPPLTNANIAGAQGDNGWYRSAVTVTLTASDQCSEIKEIHYSVNDGAITISSGNNASFAVSTDGIYTVTYYAIDKSGIAEAPSTLNIKIDKTPPRITAVSSPLANSFGWHNSDVNVVFDAFDDLSGIESYSPPVLVSSEGISQIYTGTAYDRAGNSSSTSISVNIDKSAPVATLGATPGVLWPPNHKMVNVFLEGGATDKVSGIASVVFSLVDEYGAIKNVPSGFNTFFRLEAWREGADIDGRHYTVKAVITDKAGNEFTCNSVITVPHDMRL